MATISYTSTSEQDRAVAIELRRLNARRARRGLESLTAAQFVRGLFSAQLDQLARRVRERDGDLYAKATPEDRAILDAVYDRIRQDDYDRQASASVGREGSEAVRTG